METLKKFSRMRENGFTSSFLYYQYVTIRFFAFNLELNCTFELFKNLKLHSSKRLVQFKLIEKLTHEN